MEYNQAIKELSSYKEILDELKNIAERLLQLRNPELKSRVYDDTTKVQTSGNNDLSSRLCLEEHLKTRYIERGQKSKKELDLLLDKIDMLDRVHRTLLYGKYVQGYTFQQIADKANGSRRTVCNAHKCAIIAYCKIEKTPSQ